MPQADHHPTSRPDLRPANDDLSTRPAVHMRPFELRDKEIFRELNLAWIETLFGVEEEDRRILDHPVEQVLEAGGQIYIAETGNDPVGCCALVWLSPGIYEVAKMAVSQELRGRGVGRQILSYVIEQARQLGAAELELATNTRLANAVHLYESLGFRHIPPERVGASAFTRANVFMEMHL